MKLQFLILAFLVFLSVKSQTIILTPILPPSAFQNEFYQVRFRVRNLVGAKFQFNNLPSFFTASSEGLLSGVPTKQGLYTIQVGYSNDTYKASQQVIIQVRRGTKLTNYNNDEKTQQKKSNQNSLKPKQQYLFTYQQNDQLDIQVNITNGLSPYKFQPIYVPDQLKFNNKTGAIEGSFHRYGDYLIGIKVRDAQNKQIQILIKISIQKKQDVVPTFIFYRRSMLQVKFQSNNTNNSNKNIPSLPSQSQTNKIKNQQVAPSNKNQNTSSKNQSSSSTNKQNGGAIKITPSNNQVVKTNPVNNDKKDSQTQNKLNQNLQENKNDLSKNQPKISQEISKSAESATKSPPQIVSTQQIINKNITNQVNIQQIQKKKTQYSELLQKSKDQLKICYQNVQKARSTVDNLHTAYSSQNDKVQKLKDQLQSLRTKSNSAKVQLQFKLDKQNILLTQKMLAQREFNRSLLSYQNVNFARKGALQNIKNNNQSISKIQDSIEIYKRELDKYYKILDDSMSANKKLEEQKQKINEQIKKGYGLMSKINLKVQNFGGCQNHSLYQKTTGIGQIKRVLDKIYILTNNQFVTFGDCTVNQKAFVGDFIIWKGYVKNNIISALSITKAK